MPDISMCMNSDCPRRYTCYRYRAIPNKKWQSYSNFRPINGACVNHMQIIVGDQTREVWEIDEAVQGMRKKT